MALGVGIGFLFPALDNPFNSAGSIGTANIPIGLILDEVAAPGQGAL